MSTMEMVREYEASYGALKIVGENGVWSLYAVRQAGGPTAAASATWSEGSRIGLDDLVSALRLALTTGRAEAVQTRRGSIGIYPPGTTKAYVPPGGLLIRFANAAGRRVRWEGAVGCITAQELLRGLIVAQADLEEN